jgi:hypothetical protein
LVLKNSKKTVFLAQGVLSLYETEHGNAHVMSQLAADFSTVQAYAAVGILR